MLQATEIFREEHRLLQMALVFLALLKENFQKYLKFNQTLIKNFITLFGEFVRKYHHQREEHFLFSLLKEKNLLIKEEGPVNVMIIEHKNANDYWSIIQEAFKEYLLNQDQNLLNYFYNKVENYIRFLYEHIVKEEYVLFKMVDRMLTPAQQSFLYERIKEYDRVNSLENLREKFEEMIERWKSYFWNEKLLVDLMRWNPEDQEEFIREALAGLESDGPVVFVNDYDLRHFQIIQELERNNQIQKEWELDGPHFWVLQVSIRRKERGIKIGREN